MEPLGPTALGLPQAGMKGALSHERHTPDEPASGWCWSHCAGSTTLYRAVASGNTSSELSPALGRTDTPAPGPSRAAALCPDTQSLRLQPVPCAMAGVTSPNRGTSLMRNTPLLGPYSRIIPRVLGGPRGEAVSYERVKAPFTRGEGPSKSRSSKASTASLSHGSHQPPPPCEVTQSVPWNISIYLAIT